MLYVMTVNIHKNINNNIDRVLQELNLAVVGSQIVGLVPLKAIMESADHYMEKEGVFVLEEDQKIRLVSGLSLLHLTRGLE